MRELHFAELLTYVTKLLKKTVAKMDLEIILEEKAFVSSSSFNKRGCVI